MSKRKRAAKGTDRIPDSLSQSRERRHKRRAVLRVRARLHATHRLCVVKYGPKWLAAMLGGLVVRFVKSREVLTGSKGGLSNVGKFTLRADRSSAFIKLGPVLRSDEKVKKTVLVPDDKDLEKVSPELVTYREVELLDSGATKAARASAREKEFLDRKALPASDPNSLSAAYRAGGDLLNTVVANEVTGVREVVLDWDVIFQGAKDGILVHPRTALPSLKRTPPSIVDGLRAEKVETAYLSGEESRAVQVAIHAGIAYAKPVEERINDFNKRWFDRNLHWDNPPLCEVLFGPIQHVTGPTANWPARRILRLDGSVVEFVGSRAKYVPPLVAEKRVEATGLEDDVDDQLELQGCMCHIRRSWCEAKIHRPAPKAAVSTPIHIGGKAVSRVSLLGTEHEHLLTIDSSSSRRVFCPARIHSDCPDPLGCGNPVYTESDVAHLKPSYYYESRHGSSHKRAQDFPKESEADVFIKELRRRESEHRAKVAQAQLQERERKERIREEYRRKLEELEAMKGDFSRPF